jgi:hypothetical protein
MEKFVSKSGLLLLFEKTTWLKVGDAGYVWHKVPALPGLVGENG